MEEDKKYSAAPAVYICVAIALWVLLLALKGAGVVDLHWAVVLSGIVWISWGLLAVGVLAVGIYFAAWYGCLQLKRLHRRRKRDCRIIRQAKALGVWEMPNTLGGRALELKARKEYRIKRVPGETDGELRARMEYHEALRRRGLKMSRKQERELTMAIKHDECKIPMPPPLLSGNALDVYAYEMCGINRRQGETDKELRDRCRESGFNCRDNPKGGKANE